MKISSVRMTGVQIYARSTQKSATGKEQSNGASRGSDELILVSAGSTELTTYTPDKTTANTAGTDAVAKAGIDIGDLRDTYLESIRKEVQYLLSALSRKDNDSGKNTAFRTTETSFEPLTLDSYYSAEETAARITNFALSFYSGGDRDEYVSMVKEAVAKGYGQAAKSFGGDLPSIAGKTISLVMNSLDMFAAEESA